VALVLASTVRFELGLTPGDGGRAMGDAFGDPKEGNLAVPVDLVDTEVLPLLFLVARGGLIGKLEVLKVD